MKYLLFLLLLIPCCLHAQKFHVMDVMTCKCGGTPTYTLFIHATKEHVNGWIDILNPTSPLIGDTIVLYKKQWLWHKKALFLYDKPHIVKDSIGGNSTIEYLGRDTLILPPVCFAPFTSYVQVLLDTIDDHQIRRLKTLYIKTPGNLAVIDTTKYWIVPIDVKPSKVSYQGVNANTKYIRP